MNNFLQNNFNNSNHNHINNHPSNLFENFKFNFWNHHKPYPILKKIKINLNNVIKWFFCAEFPQFCKHKKAININKKLLILLNIYYFNFKKWNDTIMGFRTCNENIKIFQSIMYQN
jgi:hypothetical protein